MKSSKKLQIQSSSAKHAATKIRNIIQEIKYQQAVFDDSMKRLTSKEIDQLENAACLLSRLGSKSKVMADALAKAEDIEANAIEKARQETENILTGWPMSTTLDKTALIYGVRGESIFNKMSNNTSDLVWSFNYYFEDSLSTIQRRISYASVTESKPVAELMCVAESKLAEIKTRSFVKDFAQRWDLILK